MPAVTFMPLNRTVEVPVGATLLRAALGNDIPIQTACFSRGLCRTCRVSVERGMKAISPRGDLEACIVPRPTPIRPFRLARQAQVADDPITVTMKPIF